jgi:hypothetical protein
LAYVIAIIHLVDSLISLSEPILLISETFDPIQNYITGLYLLRNFMDLITAISFEYLALVMGKKRRLLELSTLNTQENNIKNTINSTNIVNDRIKLSEYDINVPIIDDNEIDLEKKSPYISKKTKEKDQLI